MKKNRLTCTMDPRDNSVVLNTKLFEHLGGIEDCHKVYVFKICGSEETYGFVVNPDFGDMETEIEEVQYNPQTGNYGFACLIPSVVIMFARWGFDLETPMEIPVREQRTVFDFGSVYEFQPSKAVEA